MATTISGTAGIPATALPFLVGELKFLTGTKVPAGFIEAAGQTLSRTAYPLLWEYASTSGNLATAQAGKTKGQYGPGDGSTTFSVPDVRGEFMRALDSGAGVDVARVIGSSQEAYAGSFTALAGSDDGDSQASGFRSISGLILNGITVFANYSGEGSGITHTIPVTPGDARPRNVAFLACIFAGA